MCLKMLACALAECSQSPNPASTINPSCVQVVPGFLIEQIEYQTGNPGCETRFSLSQVCSIVISKNQAPKGGGWNQYTRSERSGRMRKGRGGDLVCRLSQPKADWPSCARLLLDGVATGGTVHLAVRLKEGPGHRRPRERLGVGDALRRALVLKRGEARGVQILVHSANILGRDNVDRPRHRERRDREPAGHGLDHDLTERVSP